MSGPDSEVRNLRRRAHRPAVRVGKRRISKETLLVKSNLFLMLCCFAVVPLLMFCIVDTRNGIVAKRNWQGAPSSLIEHCLKLL
jgi:hypothetical protein